MSKDILNEEGFNLRKFSTNSKELASKVECMNTLPKVAEVEEMTFADFSTMTSEGPCDSDSEVKVLGLVWDKGDDEFVFRFSSLLETAVDMDITKRSVLRLIAKTFDPLGLISPIIVPLKVLFQQICREHNE